MSRSVPIGNELLRAVRSFPFGARRSSRPMTVRRRLFKGRHGVDRDCFCAPRLAYKFWVRGTKVKQLLSFFFLPLHWPPVSKSGGLKIGRERPGRGERDHATFFCDALATQKCFAFFWDGLSFCAIVVAAVADFTKQQQLGQTPHLTSKKADESSSGCSERARKK